MKKIEFKFYMSTKGFKIFADYLARHEDDIAMRKNDYEDLLEIYESIYNEIPIANNSKII